MTEEREHP